MNRFGAFAIHLGISLLVFAIIGYLILFHWYPDFFFTSDGGWQGIRIVAFVDLVLGPVLTLVVFNKAKPKSELRRDLTIIGTFQAICLAAGVWVVYMERPIAIVFADGGFYSMTEADYLEVGVPVPDLTQFPGNPKWLSVRLPEDPQEQSAIRGSAMEKRTPIRALASFYEPFSPEHIDPDRDGLSTVQLERRDAITPFLDGFLESHGGELGDYIFLAFGTRYTLALLALRKADQSVLFLSVPGGLMPSEAADGSDASPTLRASASAARAPRSIPASE